MGTGRHGIKGRLAAAALAATLALAGCGGGGGDGGPAPASNPPPQSATAEGFWSGTTSSGFSILGAVLDTGEYWFMYHANGLLYGVVQGTGTSNNGSFSSSNGLDFELGGPVTPVAVSASYQSRASLQGVATAQSGVGSITFTTAYDASYETPATAAAVAGVWRGRLANGETYTLNVGSDGAFTGAGSSGCTFSGTVAPRPGGKAVYAISVRFNGGVCALGTQSISGIAVTAGGGAQQVLFAAALTPARTAGFVIIAGR